MTTSRNCQEYINKTVANSALLDLGMRDSLALDDREDPTASALILGQLQTLSVMLVAGDVGEKIFARKRLRKFLADGKRLDKAKARNMPETQGAAP